MATTLTLSPVQARLGWTYNKTLTWSDASNASEFSYSSNFADGVGAGQCNRIYIAQGTILASQTLTLDLAGALTDIYGTTITFARVKALYLEITTDTAGTSVAVGGNAAAAMSQSNGFFGDPTYTFRIKNGGMILLVDKTATGYPVTATTYDKLDIVNEDSGAAVTYKIVIAGGAT